MIPNVESSSSYFSIYMVIFLYGYFFYFERVRYLSMVSQHIHLIISQSDWLRLWSFDHSECNKIPTVEIYLRTK